jgi:hypothetical protein
MATKKLSAELIHALAMQLADQAKETPLVPGAYTIGHEIALKVTGSITRDEDYEGKPGKAKVPILLAIAAFVDLCGIENGNLKGVWGVALRMASWKEIPAERKPRIENILTEISNGLAVAERNAPTTPAETQTGKRHNSTAVEVVAIRKVRPASKRAAAKA